MKSPLQVMLSTREDMPAIRLLVIDDSREIRSSFQHFFEMLWPRCEVRCVSGFGEVFSLESQPPYDFIIVDMFMYGPSLDDGEDGCHLAGLRLLPHLEKLYPRAHIAILTALTSPLFGEVAKRTQEDPHVDFLWRKPKAIDEIALDISRVIRESRGHSDQLGAEWDAAKESDP